MERLDGTDWGEMPDGNHS
jgi:hypothetical protein